MHLYEGMAGEETGRALKTTTEDGMHDTKRAKAKKPWPGEKQKRPKNHFDKIRESTLVNVLFCVLIPAITTLTLEWIARGTLAGNSQGNGFFEALAGHFPSFLLSYLLLVAVYIFVCFLSRMHWLATLVVGLVGNVPAVVTYFKLTMRGEPFLPWDLSQIGDLMAVKSSVELSIPASVFITAGIFVVLVAMAAFVRVSRGKTRKADWISRGIAAGTAAACMAALLFGVFFNASGTAAVGIREDMWMQDRYYRTNGVITGFLTNLQLLNINEPEDYSAGAVEGIRQMILDGMAEDSAPFFEDCYAAKGGNTQTPDIIFVMAESFWDVTALPGVEYDQPITQNLQRLARQGAYGTAYSPSYGGGTCDVEFEVLTGFSMEFLPSGSKPFQQYITDDIFALPQLLKAQGYSTVAVHGYGRRFWNRDMAYPRLGIDTFVAEDDFVDPDRKRGFISDDAMVDQVIEELEKREADGPVFVHAVTMQNHTTYSRNRYPEDQLVNVVSYPVTVSNNTIGQLEDCATGIRDMDAALGKLADYLSARERPAILVFWGDHMNPMSDGTALFEGTGFIEEGNTSSPRLHETPLLYWTNFDDSAVDLGTIATYNIAPVMMDLYGMEKPLMFDYLMQQMRVARGHTRGVTIEPDSTYSYEMTEEQQQYFEWHKLLQYDYLFGEKVLESYVPKEN